MRSEVRFHIQYDTASVNTGPTNLQTFDELSLVSGHGQASSLQLLLEVVDFHLQMVSFEGSVA